MNKFKSIIEKVIGLFIHKKNNPTDKIDITHKRFRWSDFIAEKIIKSVAFLSITIIILIFFFVFREAFPIFSFAEKEKPKTEQSSATQEQYGTETTKPEKQEQYGVESNKSEQQEQYGVQTDEDTTMGESFTPIEATESGSSTDNNKSAIKTLPTKTWQPVSDNPRYGLLPLLIGTIKITIISLLFAGPLAILAALYTSVFAPKRLKELIKPTIEMLAGVPSVVIGFFALMVMATFLQNLFGYDVRLNSFVGGIAMGLAAIPIIYTITEDALTAVPKTYYEASLALGASKWQTAFFVILPAATPGIFAAVLLGIGRVFGETMIALMATGNAAMMGLNPFESVRTLAATIGAEMAEVVFGDTHYNVLFLIGSMLFIFTFALNAIAEFWVKGKLMKKIQGK
ncbi:MAG: phosphate ABC transporter permease subunit PstC [Bacteroidales bacterium]